jgi:hypothetical protein
VTACVLYSWGARYELQVPPEVSAQEARQDQQQGLPRAGSGLPGGDRCRDGSEREKQSRVSVPLNQNKKQQFWAQGTVINAVLLCLQWCILFGFSAMIDIISHMHSNVMGF